VELVSYGFELGFSVMERAFCGLELSVSVVELRKSVSGASQPPRTLESKLT
jgi:hypothetical protein